MRRPILIAALSAILIIVAHRAIVFAQAQDASQSSNGQTQTFDISAKKYEFTPAEIHVKQGAKVELKVHSEDETHGVKLDPFPQGTKDKKTPGLVFDAPNENGKVSKGVDQVIDFVAQTPGTYEFKCAKVCGLGHGRMKGQLIVEP